MTEQEHGNTGGRLFTVDPSKHGLWERVTEAGRISHQAWLRAVSENGFVGTCRRCGSYLRPRSADDRGNGVFDYEAECTNQHQSTVAGGERSVAGCGAVMVAPGGRLPGTAERERKAAAAAKRDTKRGAKK